ncbi:hypothetical protein QVD17_00111 [Tagetes erecta]|uniref:Uncharacterized protein n=1 Tax=Tagetes erecta TaxID=13708 RepID=A0AAD8P6X8_TARER|nr:hypothetical protein QVD17_00111 [Tagetes erecta]
MGDSSVESSNLARKLLKIDGNPRVNLLRGSSKGNDPSKPSPSSRHPVRGTAITSNMMVNPKDALGDPANVVVHTAKVDLHTAKEIGHDPAKVGAHTARVELHTAKGNVHDPANVGDPAKVVDPANIVDSANVVADPANVDVDPANVVDSANVVEKANAYTAKGNVNNGHETDLANAYMVGVDNHMANAYMAKGVMNNDTANSHTAGVHNDDTNVIHESNAVASLDEERFLKQKAKVHWLAKGDANTKFFHNTLKCRNHRARIDVITDSHGILHEGKEVPRAFVDHYVGFLGKEEAVIMPITQELFDVRIDQTMSLDMIRMVTFDEIKRTMFAFADDKAPGPDGFTAAFYKKAWDIVDDLFLFARGELSSAKVIMNSLIDFAGMSGLSPSNQKSTIFFCNVPTQTKNSILNIMPFVEGKLPVRYLGVPLVAARVKTTDCRVLIEKVENRIGDWKNKLLSFAGRCQLINSVISSLHVFWSSVFILSSRIMHDIEAKMRDFLWARGPLKRSRARVSWKDVCRPKTEGGLDLGLLVLLLTFMGHVPGMN